MKHKIGDRPDYGAFIPSELDDYGLDPFTFRVFCHISRRAGTGGREFYEGDKTAAAHCCMDLKTYRKAKHLLEKMGMILIEKRPGQTALIQLQHHKNWNDKPEKGAPKNGSTLSQIQPHPKTDQGAPRNGSTSTQKRVHPDITAPKNGSRGAPKNGSGVDPKTDHKGTPYKGIHSEGTPEIKDSLSPKGSLPHVPIADAQQPNSRERETSASAPSTAEIQTAVTATAPAPPRPSSSPERSQTSNGQTQYSAAPPPDIFDLDRWSNFSAPGKQPDFWASVLNQVAKFKDPPANPVCAAEAWIQKQGHLLWDEFQKSRNGNGNGNSIKLPDLKYSRVFDQDLPQFDDQGDDLAAIANNLKLRNWGWDDPQIQLWVIEAQNTARNLAWPTIEYRPILGSSNWPAWAIAKFAHDLGATPPC